MVVNYIKLSSSSFSPTTPLHYFHCYSVPNKSAHQIFKKTSLYNGNIDLEDIRDKRERAAGEEDPYQSKEIKHIKWGDQEINISPFLCDSRGGT
jgi:hypothetical protein